MGVFKQKFRDKIFRMQREENNLPPANDEGSVIDKSGDDDGNSPLQKAFPLNEPAEDDGDGFLELDREMLGHQSKSSIVEPPAPSGLLGKIGSSLFGNIAGTKANIAGTNSNMRSSDDKSKQSTPEEKDLPYAQAEGVETTEVEPIGGTDDQIQIRIDSERNSAVDDSLNGAEIELYE